MADDEIKELRIKGAGASVRATIEEGRVKLMVSVNGQDLLGVVLDRQQAMDLALTIHLAAADIILAEALKNWAEAKGEKPC